VDKAQRVHHPPLDLSVPTQKLQATIPLSKCPLPATIRHLILNNSNLGVLYMALTTAATADIIKAHQRSKNDTGSSEVQISLLTARIIYLTLHMKTNPHDYHTRYGLTKLVSQRRRLMTYLKRVNPASYRELIQTLDVRG